MKKLLTILAAVALSLLGVTAPAALAGAAPSTTHIAVDGWQNPSVTTAESAWSKNTNVTLDPASACTGHGCIHVLYATDSPCDAEGLMQYVAGCSYGDTDGSCTAQINPFDTLFGAQAVLAAVEHEMGHCLGLGHSTDPHSIMQANINPYSPPKGPDHLDRVNVQALYP